MTSPQSPYPHGGHGPGPSYYHQPSPVYTSNSPGPNPYAYQYPPQPPPHLNPQHHPGSSRSNGRGGGPAYNSRNQPHNPYPYYPPYGHHPAPVAMQPPHPPPHSYSRNPPFSQGYGYLNPAAVPFTPPPRHTPQPMSPTPKRPAMPPPLVNSPGYYDPSPEIPIVSHLPSGPVPIMSPRAQKPSVPSQLPIPPSVEPSEGSSEPVNGLVANESASNFSMPEEEEQHETPPSPEPSLPPQAPQSSAYNQMGTIHTQEASSHPENSSLSEPVESSSDSASAHPLMSWAVWSRRPRDPSNAPGIIISPKARPPPKIVDGALESKTPPVSSPPSPAVSKKKKKLPHPASRVNGLLDVLSSQTSSTVPSSAGTENADTPTVPGSPLSTNTSISTSGGNEETALKPEVKEAPKPESEEATDEAQPSVASAVESSDLSLKDQEVSSTPTPAAVPASQVSTPKVEAAPAPEPIPEPSASTSTSSSTPAPAPAPAAVPKKSWASLLRPAESSSATATPTKNALPTSSIVGISIPAGVTSSPPPQPVSPSKKTELINLLTSNPSNAPITSKIRPRGLVNSGNMCFANAVLQILLYCAPFHRLFLELGKLLPAVATQKDGASSGSSAPSASSSVTPLVEATVTFLKEFVTPKKPLLINGKSGAMSGVASGSGYGRGNKGKEREMIEMDDDWDLDSFLPTYIYDAMKEKKRFDTMRGGQQEDAEEFLGFYLDTLEEELLSMLNSTQPSKPHVEETETVPTKEEGWMEVGKKNRTVVTRTIKATESPITRIFGGKFRSTLRAPRQKDSVVVEDWRSLRLDIQRDQIRTIQDALSYISQPEPVQVSIPTQPGVAVEATQQVLIESLPPILVLHIKRFCYDMNVKGVIKVGKQVQFGPELEIGSDLMAPAAKKTGPTRYKLFGALYHHGLSASGGHYTLDVLHPNRYPSFNPNAKPKEGWVRIDDDLVSDVRPEDVFGAAQEKDDSRKSLPEQKVQPHRLSHSAFGPDQRIHISKERRTSVRNTTRNRQAVMLGVTGFDIFNLGDDHAHHLVQLIYASLHLILITTGVHVFLSIYGFSVFKETRSGKRKQSRVPYLMIGCTVFALFSAYNILTSVYLADLLINTGTEEAAFEEFIVANMGGWVSVWATVCQMGVTFIGTGLLIYRCYLVWERKIWVVLFPSFAGITSFALAIVLLVGLRRSSIVQMVPFQYGCAWVSLSAGANVYSSSLIAFRLLQARFSNKELNDRLQQFTGNSAILVESALPFSFFGVASAVVYSPSLAVKPASVPVMATWTCLSALAAQFIAFRVVIGMSYTDNPGAVDFKGSEKGVPEPMTFARTQQDRSTSTATHETQQTLSHVSAIST